MDNLLKRGDRVEMWVYEDGDSTRLEQGTVLMDEIPYWGWVTVRWDSRSSGHYFPVARERVVRVAEVIHS
jgi:hypothetical protein